MTENAPLRRDLKEKFLLELTPSEKIIFLKKAREAVGEKGYPAGEDLFYYCYFYTLQQRFRGLKMQGAEGYQRLLFVDGAREVREAEAMYEERLEKKKRNVPDPGGTRFIEFFSE